MRKSWVHAARVAEVRQAARDWRGSGVIDGQTLEAIDALYPDPRSRLARAWKALIFFLVSVAIHAVSFGLVEVAQSSGKVAYWIASGMVLAGFAEVLRASRFAGNGSDAAVSFWALTYLLFGLGVGFVSGPKANVEFAITLVLIAAAILFAAACVHWGYSAYGAFATGSFFLFLGRFPGGRIVWIVAAMILMSLAYARLDHDYAPPLRKAVAAVFACSGVALYVAINRYSLDERWIEELGAHSSTSATASDALLGLSAVATALVPVAFVSWGIRVRRVLILDLGLVFAAASLVTLRYYVHIAPLWAVLTFAGAALILAALWLDRFLRRAPGGERDGFTSAPLTSVKGAETFQAAAVVAGFTSSPAPAKAGEFSPGGGGFGGAGSSGKF
jgi:hypothetical protein